MSLLSKSLSDSPEVFVGKQVTVWIGNGTRASFEPQISVAGILEGKPLSDEYRIVVNTGTYTYFTAACIVNICERTDGALFKDGSVAVIYINLNSD